jgi:Delta3-Delta2-enoyl-CoA isomerase
MVFNPFCSLATLTFTKGHIHTFTTASPSNSQRSTPTPRQSPAVGAMCTLEQRGRVFVLTLTGDGEHPLGHQLIASLRSAVAAAAASAGPGAALVTVAEGRFFSNGLDLGWAGSSLARLGELVDALRPLAADLLALPMPTIAAVTGHAAAGGFFLALCHDYRIMRADRGVLYMSEIDIGLPLPPYFVALFRNKITAANALRDVTLRGKKLKAAEAKEMGIVDAVCPSPAETAAEAIKLAEQFAARKWDGNVYASIRMSIFPEACKSVGIVEENDEVKRKHFASRL